MRQVTATDLDQQNTAPGLLLFCGLLGILGSFAPTVTMLWASVVTDHKFLAETVSDLGRGPHRFIMDTGFYLNAASLIALAIGTTVLHPGFKRWSMIILTFTFLALTIVAIGIWDAFGQTSDAEGMSVHTRLTFALGPLYVIGPLLMWSVFRAHAPRMAWAFAISAALWIVFATAFKLAPDWIDGGLEKIAIAATLLWTIPYAWWMVNRARANL